MKTLVAAIVCAIAALATLGAYALSAWMPPLRPLIVGAVAILIPFISAVLVLEPDSRRPPWTLAGLTVVLGIVLGVAVPSLWVSPKVRQAAVERFADRSAIKLALGDVDPAVQVRACQMMFSAGMPSVEIAAELAAKPGVAVACLDEALVAHRSVSNKILATWQDTITHSQSDSCALAEQATALPGSDASEKAFGFLECAVNGSAGARSCCLAQLKALDAPKNMRPWLSASQKELIQSGLTGRLLLVSHQESQTLKELPGIEGVGLAKPELQYLTLDHACQALLQGDADMVASGVTWVFGEHEKCLSEEERTADLSIASACRVIVAGEFGGDIDRQICAANQVSRREKLEERREQANQPSQNFGELVDMIAEGESIRSRQVNLDAFAAAAMSGADTNPLQGYTPAELARVRAEVQARGKNAPTKDAVKATAENRETLENHRANPLTKGLFEAKSESDIAKIRSEFEARAKKAGKGIDEAP